LAGGNPMNKEEILEQNRKDNSGKLDERETEALGKASYVGMVTGLILCAALVIISEFILNLPVLGYAAWMVWFAMHGSQNVVLFKKLKEKKRLVYAVIEFILAAAFCVCIFLRSGMI